MIDLNAPNVVPLGKYKGQPVEVLAQDKSYVEWLLSQPWVRERYASFHTLIVNNFSTDSETPEHNSLQVLFLDDAFCFSFVRHCEAKWLNALKREPVKDAMESLERRLDEAKKEIAWYGEKLRSGEKLYDYQREQYHRAVQLEGALVRHIVTLPKELTYNLKFIRQFEVRGVDVILDVAATSNEKIPSYDGVAAFVRSKCLHIEIKPSVGDDYPAILRQMRVNGSRYLFTQKYTGIGATKEQFVQTMKLSGIEVMFREDLDDGQHT